MADSIKELLLDAFVADLVSGVSSLNSVELNSIYLPKGDESNLEKPFAKIVDMDEEIEEDNRYRIASFDIVVVSYVHSDISSDLTKDIDAIHAEVYKRICESSCTFKGYCVRFKEKSYEKMYFNETEGCAMDTWTITYRTCRGDPYTMTANP